MELSATSSLLMWSVDGFGQRRREYALLYPGVSKKPQKALTPDGCGSQGSIHNRSDKLNIREFIRIMTNIPIHIWKNPFSCVPMADEKARLHLTTPSACLSHHCNNVNKLYNDVYFTSIACCELFSILSPLDRLSSKDGD